MEDPVQKPVNQQDQQAPISVSPRRESEPLLASNREINLHPDVQAAGVQVIAEDHKLDELDKKIGMTLPGASTPVPTQPVGSVKLPMLQEEAKRASQGKESDSLTFFGALVDRVYRVRQLLGFGGKKVTV